MVPVLLPLILFVLGIAKILCSTLKFPGLWKRTQDWKAKVRPQGELVFFTQTGWDGLHLDLGLSYLEDAVRLYGFQTLKEANPESQPVHHCIVKKFFSGNIRWKKLHKRL